MKPSPGRDGFPHYDPRYTCDSCCCGPIHCKTGARRVGIFLTFVLVLQITNGFYNKNIGIVSGSIHIAKIIITILLFVGISRMNPRLVLPYVFFTFIHVLSTIFLIIFLFVVIIQPYSSFGNLLRTYLEGQLPNEPDKTYIRVFSILGISLCVLGLVLAYWFFDIIKRCYNYLRDFEYHCDLNTEIPVEYHP